MAKIPRISKKVHFPLSFLVVFSVLAGILNSAPALAGCVTVLGRRVCTEDLDPTRHIPGSERVAEEAWGEAGRVGYTTAAQWMRANNGSGQGLDDTQKKYLRTKFGNLVDRVTVTYNANLMDEWSAGGYRIDIGDSHQTYCDRIYIDDPYQPGNFDQIVTIAHELVHSRQCQQLGGASNFGYHYFKEFKKAGQNYRNNKLEQEAYNEEAQFKNWLASNWNSSTSNEISAGLYRLPDGKFISANDTGAFCSFVSPAHFEFLSGQYDLVQSIDSSRISAMDNHGACAVRLPAGAYRLVDGRIIASNGSAFCRYVSYEHYERKDRRPIRQFNGEIPLHAMENHFNCHQ